MCVLLETNTYSFGESQLYTLNYVMKLNSKEYKKPTCEKLWKTLNFWHYLQSSKVQQLPISAKTGVFGTFSWHENRQRVIFVGKFERKLNTNKSKVSWTFVLWWIKVIKNVKLFRKQLYIRLYSTAWEKAFDPHSVLWEWHNSRQKRDRKFSSKK